MWFWSWLRRSFLPVLIGISLAMVLHSCQLESRQPELSSSPEAAVIPSELSQGVDDSSPVIASVPPALSPEAQAIIDGVGPDGLYNPPRGDVRLVAISDLNGAYGATDYDPEVDKAIALLPFWDPDVVICGGDMVAGQKTTLSDAQLQAMWAAFDEHVAEPLRQMNIPYGFTLGNHDASAAQDGAGGFVFERERIIAADYWNAPAHDPGIEFIDDLDFPFYYTFRFEDVFFLVWDGSSFKIPSEKLAWVEQALASPADQSAQLKILVGHLPLYGVAVGRDKPGEVMANADQLRQIAVEVIRHGLHSTPFGFCCFMKPNR